MAVEIAVGIILAVLFLSIGVPIIVGLVGIVVSLFFAFFEWCGKSALGIIAGTLAVLWILILMGF